MWRDKNSGVIVKTHSELRNLRPYVSMPAVMTDDVIAATGFEPLVQEVQPTYNPLTHKLVEKVPVKVNGLWTQGWDVVALPAEQATANVAAMKASYLAYIRDLREKCLNRLSGIATVALATNDTATVEAFKVARERLLNITTIPGVAEATSELELENVIGGEWRAIGYEAPAALRSAFNKLDF